MIRSILLDTCALIWLAEGQKIDDTARDALRETEEAGAVFVSPISAWEVGLLVARNRIALSRDPLGWFEDLVAGDLELAPLPPSTLIAASFLPSCNLRDPADRILVATARALNLRLMTRDRPILDYAAEGHVAAIAC
ncbi:MAG: type II toxin-antitoxin system VapC family toxin [Caulobacteraceae bacterium]